LKALELCKKKRFPFSVDLEKLIKDYHVPEAELKKSKNRIKEDDLNHLKSLLNTKFDELN